jgi:hypothetical protein
MPGDPGIDGLGAWNELLAQPTNSKLRINVAKQVGEGRRQCKRLLRFLMSHYWRQAL